MKKILSLSLALICGSGAFAQNTASTGFNVLTTNETTNIPSFIAFTDANVPAQNGLEQWFQKNLNANKEFTLKMISETSKDNAGNYHAKYLQYYQGIPVEGAMVNLHYKGNVPHSVNGDFYPNLTASTAATFNEEKAFSVAKSYFQNNSFAWDNAAYENLLKRSKNNPAATHFPKAILKMVATENNVFKLAYGFDILAIAPITHKLIFVDAQNGSILSAKELMMDVEVNGVARTKYSGTQTIQCDSVDPAGFILQEWGRGAYIGTSRFVSTGGPGSFSSELFYDYDNDWNNYNFEIDEIATDIHWGLEKTHDFYMKKFGRNSIDNAGHDLTAIAHFEYYPSEKLANAAWTGDFMIYGDGDDTSMNPLTSIDITGHEVSHGLTQETAGLIYKNEPGALNESFSDIFGKSIEYYATPKSFSWEIGKKIMMPGKSSLRSMSNPNAFGLPKYYKGKFYYTGTLDEGGVHTNSGVQNFWFYLLVTGGKGTREDGKAYDVKAMGFDTAATISYMNLTSYLVPGSKYIDAANNSLAYTKLTYGDSSSQAYNVQMAWYAVGVLDKPVAKFVDTAKIPASINNVSLSNTVKVYPNPSAGLFTVTADNAFDNASLQVINVTGQVVVSKENISGTSVSLDISAQAAGLYILEIKENGNVVSRTKLLKK